MSIGRFPLSLENIIEFIANFQKASAHSEALTCQRLRSY